MTEPACVGNDGGDFRALVEGRLTSQEYVDRLTERVRAQREANGPALPRGPIVHVKDFVRRYFPNARQCPHCDGTGIEAGSDTTVRRNG